MVWLTWRQHRYEALAAVALLVLVLLALINTGLDVASLAQSDSRELNIKDYFPMPLTLLSVLPLLLSMFVGAPLVAREVEQGTHRLVWTQGVTPLQWLSIKLALLGGAILLAWGVLFLVMSWWNRPVNQVLGPWQTFDYQGPVILAYALFGFALGLALGTWSGKTLPAMALALPIFLIVIAGVGGLRAHYLPPLSSTWDFTGSNPQARDWVLTNEFVDQAGNVLFGSADQAKAGLPLFGAKARGLPLPNICVEAMATNAEAGQACLHDGGYTLRQVFQPASRFWLFQGIETGIFLALTAGLIALTFWGVKRRVRN